MNETEDKSIEDGRRPQRLKILGVDVDPVDASLALRRVSDYLKSPGCKQVVTINPEYVMLAGTSSRLMRLLNRAELNVPDGIGIVWASRRLGLPLAGRVTGADLLPQICGLCESDGHSIYLLGGAEGVARQAAANLQASFPRLEIAGTSSRDPDADTNHETIAEINSSGAAILAVAYGCPKQDFWIDRNRDLLTGVRVALGVGGAFDFIAGRVPRAPRLLRQAGLEWLYRLWLEPSRYRRMAALPRFGFQVLRSRQR